MNMKILEYRPGYHDFDASLKFPTTKGLCNKPLMLNGGIIWIDIVYWSILLNMPYM